MEISASEAVSGPRSLTSTVHHPLLATSPLPIQGDP
jgi:hypothetical protein